MHACKVVFAARTMLLAAAEQAAVTFDMLQTQVLQSIVTAGGGGFGPLQQTLAGLPLVMRQVSFITAAAVGQPWLLPGCEFKLKHLVWVLRTLGWSCDIRRTCVQPNGQDEMQTVDLNAI
jgi:hypothetical protein